VLHAEIVGRHFHGRRTVRLWTDDGASVRDTIDAIGHVPLPPYIKRADAIERSRSLSTCLCAPPRIPIAAPTAEPALYAARSWERSTASASKRASVTFARRAMERFNRFRVDCVEQLAMEAEYYEVGAAAAALAITKAKRETGASSRSGHNHVPHARSAGGAGRRRRHRRLKAKTALFIHPGHAFQLVSGLIHELPLAEIVAH
jgi:S-adenosylmethionine:tRNA ribosyltransferase-isomerase